MPNSSIVEKQSMYGVKHRARPYLGTNFVCGNMSLVYNLVYRVLTVWFGGCELVSHLGRHVLPHDGNVYVMSMLTN